jgi:hypothetical protein
MLTVSAVKPQKKASLSTRKSKPITAQQSRWSEHGKRISGLLYVTARPSKTKKPRGG